VSFSELKELKLNKNKSPFDVNIAPNQANSQLTLVAKDNLFKTGISPELLQIDNPQNEINKSDYLYNYYFTNKFFIFFKNSLLYLYLLTDLLFYLLFYLFIFHQKEICITIIRHLNHL